MIKYKINNFLKSNFKSIILVLLIYFCWNYWVVPFLNYQSVKATFNDRNVLKNESFLHYINDVSKIENNFYFVHKGDTYVMYPNGVSKVISRREYYFQENKNYFVKVHREYISQQFTVEVYNKTTGKRIFKVKNVIDYTQIFLVDERLYYNREDILPVKGHIRLLCSFEFKEKAEKILIQDVFEFYYINDKLVYSLPRESGLFFYDINNGTTSDVICSSSDLDEFRKNFDSQAVSNGADNFYFSERWDKVFTINATTKSAKICAFEDFGFFQEYYNGKFYFFKYTENGGIEFFSYDEKTKEKESVFTINVYVGNSYLSLREKHVFPKLYTINNDEFIVYVDHFTIYNKNGVSKVLAR